MSSDAAREELKSALEKARNGDYVAARVELERLTATLPEFADGHFYLGLVQERLEDFASARDSFERAVQIDPFNEEARSHLRGLPATPHLPIPPTPEPGPIQAPPISAAERLAVDLPPPAAMMNAEGAGENAEQLAYYSYAVAPGGFWIRFLGYFLDTLLLSFAFAPFQRLIDLGYPEQVQLLEDHHPAELIVLLLEGAPDQLPGFLVYIVITLVLNFIFHGTVYTLFHYQSGQTPGKRILGLRVVDAETLDYLSGLQSFGRYIASGMSGLLCSVGYIMAGLNADKRALHDYIAGTRVVYSEPVQMTGSEKACLGLLAILAGLNLYLMFT